MEGVVFKFALCTQGGSRASKDGNTASWDKQMS